MARPVAEPASSLQGAASRRPPPSYSAMASESSLGPRSQQLASVLAPSQQPAGGGGNERTPLLNSIGAAAESLVNNSVVVGSMQQGVSWRMAAFLLVNSALGAGMLNYPFAYNQIGGVLAAALMQVVLLIFISSTMFILVYCADFNQDNTYHDVLLSMCGKRAQQISALSILFTCYGINVTFLVIIGDQYDRIFNSLLTHQQLDELWFLERKFTIFITAVLFIWPMCYAQRLDFLRYASVLGMFSMLYVAFLTVYEHFALDQAGSDQQQAVGSELAAAITAATNSSAPAQSAASSYRWWFEPLAIVPVLCFAYQTHEVIVPVYACMRQRHMASFMKASFFGLLILFFLYNLVGAFGYLTFGARVGADIMSLYDGKDPVVVVGIVALVVKFITTYPPLMFCGRSALDGLYAELRQLSAVEFKQNERARRLAISTIWFLSTVALAVFAPDISVTLQLLGSMASINVFVFPGMCLLSLTRRLRRARHALLMGEPPAGASGQRAKDYHLISGSYFGHAMRRRQQLQSSLRNQLISGASGQQQQQQQRVIGQPAGCYRAGHQPCCDNHQVNHSNHHHHHHNGHNNRQLEQPTTVGSAPTNRHFTATFASLMEFEKNLAHNSTSSEPAAKLNGAARQQVASAPSPLSASSSNLLLSSAENSAEFLANAKPALQNGYVSTNGAPQASQRAHQDQHLASATRARLRQQHFERMLAAREPRDQQAACDCATPARSINDSQHDCSDCDDETAPLAKRHLKLDCSHRQLVQQQQQVLSSLSSSFRQLVGASQKLQADERAQLWASDKKSGPPLAPLSSFQQNQCMQSSTDLNHHEQSINNSLLNKFSSSIAPSTVAQIGISRCAALGLYSFAGLLITFGTFIFIIELVNVLGVLN